MSGVASVLGPPFPALRGLRATGRPSRECEPSQDGSFLDGRPQAIQTRGRDSAASGAKLIMAWTFFQNRSKLISSSRWTLLLGFVINHLIHRCDQLGVYFCLDSIPSLPICGPPDEKEREGF